VHEGKPQLFTVKKTNVTYKLKSLIVGGGGGAPGVFRSRNEKTEGEKLIHEQSGKVRNARSTEDGGKNVLEVQKNQKRT